VRAIAALLLLVTPTSPAQADIDGDTFRSREWRVQITAPANWRLTDQAAYPTILVRMARHSPNGRMLLAAEQVNEDLDALAYAARTAKKLEAMGFTVRAPQLHAATGAYLIDFQSERSFLRQALLVSGGLGYSLTLSTADARTRAQLLRAFDTTLRSLRVLRPEEVAPAEEAEAEPDERPAPPTPAP
jgi:hypothetical protein